LLSDGVLENAAAGDSCDGHLRPPDLRTFSLRVVVASVFELLSTRDGETLAPSVGGVRDAVVVPKSCDDAKRVIPTRIASE
jgi:hypothetical protein